MALRVRVALAYVESDEALLIQGEGSGDNKSLVAPSLLFALMMRGGYALNKNAVFLFNNVSLRERVNSFEPATYSLSISISLSLFECFLH